MISPRFCRQPSLRNPLTGAPYAGNHIPAAQENPVAAALFASKYYPTTMNNNLMNNAINQTNQTYQHRPGRCQGRLEYHPERSSQRPLFAGIPERPDEQLAADSGQYLRPYSDSNAVGTWTHTFGPNILNEARFGASWMTISHRNQLRPQHRQPGHRAGHCQRQYRRAWPAVARFWRRHRYRARLTGTLTNLGSNVVDSEFRRHRHPV